MLFRRLFYRWPDSVPLAKAQRRQQQAMLLGLAALLWATQAQATELAGTAATVLDDGQTRIELQFDEAVKWRWFRLTGPERVVIDIDAAVNNTRAPQPAGLLRNMRFGELENGLRVVLDLSDEPDEVSLQSAQPGQLAINLAPASPAISAPAVSAPATVTKPAPVPVIATRARPVVVVIDPGHGGKDSGAVGRSGLLEKSVALSIARDLALRLKQQGRYQVHLTRDRDEFVPLRQRMRLARQAGADLFVSIHADAFGDPRAHGSSVYILSNRGASSEHARLLARRENEADLIGGVDLQDRDDVLAAVLLDISQSAALDASYDIGSRVLGGMRALGPLHKSDVQRAGFVVLKSPDVPSILVETAFISNPQEEKQLGSRAHRQRIAAALADGIGDYFDEYRPAQVVRLDGGEHEVRAGETLTGIAQRYKVPLAELRALNKLRKDAIRVGQKLRLPLYTAGR